MIEYSINSSSTEDVNSCDGTEALEHYVEDEPCSGRSMLRARVPPTVHYKVIVTAWMAYGSDESGSYINCTRSYSSVVSCSNK